MHAHKSRKLCKIISILLALSLTYQPVWGKSTTTDTLRPASYVRMKGADAIFNGLDLSPVPAFSDTNRIKLTIVRDYNAMSCLVAYMVLIDYKKAIAEKGCYVLGLPTGSTPSGLYKILVKFAEAGLMDFKKVITFNMDEYEGLGPEYVGNMTPLDPGDPNISYKAYMYQQLFKPLFDRGLISQEDINKNVNMFESNPMNADEMLAEYEKKIEELGGIDTSIGSTNPEGHIAFNGPKSYVITDGKRIDVDSGTTPESVSRRVYITQATVDVNRRFFEYIDGDHSKGRRWVVENGNNLVFVKDPQTKGAREISHDEAIAAVKRTAFSIGVKTFKDARHKIILRDDPESAEIMAKGLEGEPDNDIAISLLQDCENCDFIITERTASRLANPPAVTEVLPLESLLKTSSAGRADYLKKGTLRVLVEENLGVGLQNDALYGNQAYIDAGAEVVGRKKLWQQAHMVLKVKEPLREGGVNEFELMEGMRLFDGNELVIGVAKEIKPQEGRVALLPDGVMELLEFAKREGCSVGDIQKMLVTYFHFAASKELTEKTIAAGVTALALEGIRGDVESAALFNNNEWLVGKDDPKGEPSRIVVPSIVKDYKELMEKRGKLTLPCLDPMSIVAGAEAVLQGAIYLHEGKVKIVDGKIIVEPGWEDHMLNSYPDLPDMNALKGKTVLITGSGAVGLTALWNAMRFGAKVVITDIDDNLNDLRDILVREYGGDKVKLQNERFPIHTRERTFTDILHEECDIIITGADNKNWITDAFASSDLTIGAALIPEKRAPITIDEKMICHVAKYYPMRRAMVDVPIDQKGNFVFIDPDGKEIPKTATYHSAPVRLILGNIISYDVGNMPGRPGVIARAAAKMFQASRLPFLKKIIKDGMIASARADGGLMDGLTVIADPKVKRGVLTSKSVAQTEGFNLSSYPVKDILSNYESQLKTSSARQLDIHNGDTALPGGAKQLDLYINTSQLINAAA